MTRIRRGCIPNCTHYGIPVYIPNANNVNAASNSCYTSWLDIEQWMVRNLMTFKNCLLKQKFYAKFKRQFVYLFGSENITEKPTSDGFIVLEITEEGRNNAKPFVLEEEENG